MGISGLSEYAAGFQYTDNERGITVTRVFHYDPVASYNNTDLPKPGDEFTFPFSGSSDLSLLGYMPKSSNKIICRERTMNPLAGDQRAYQWTVTYNNEPVDPTVFNLPSDSTSPGTSPSQLPISLEYSGEFMLTNPPAEKGTNPNWKWKWTNVSPPNNEVTVPIPKRVNTSTLRIVRYVKDTDYNIFQGQVRSCTGKVNSNADPFKGVGGGIECWLFVGVSTEYFRNSNDVRWWRAELEFNYRNPDGTDSKGWNKLLRQDGIWDIPVAGSSTYIYESTNFDVLWT